MTREDSAGSGASSPDREPYRERDEDELGAAWARGVAARGGRVVVVTYPRTANNDKELSVARGEFLELLDDSRKWWRARNRRGHVAHVPHTIVAPAALPPATQPPPAPPAPRDPSPPHLYPNPVYSHAEGGRGSGGSSPPESSVPPPPPPPPLPSPPAAPKEMKKTDTMKSGASAASLHEELQLVLPQLQQRRAPLEFMRTPDIYIDQKSNPEEVGSWLEAKGFTGVAARRLRLAGHQLFALSREQLQRALGDSDGKRLYSQLLVQRNISGYKTTSASELQSILRKVREKVEVS